MRALILAVMLVAPLACFGDESGSRATQLPAEVDAWLRTRFATVRTIFGEGEELPSAETLIGVSAQLQPDPVDDFALLYPVEGERGGTDWAQYLAVFLRHNGKLKFCWELRLGEKGGILIEALYLDGGTLHLSGKEFVPGEDAYCCPSKPWTATVRVDRGRLNLISVRPTSDKRMQATAYGGA
jgi:hypothetical protein